MHICLIFQVEAFFTVYSDDKENLSEKNERRNPDDNFLKLTNPRSCKGERAEGA